MLTVIVAGRNDDYGQDFRQRLFRAALHNCALFNAAGIEFEYMLAEWNPLPDRVPLSIEFVNRIPNARSVIIPAEIHQEYTLNPSMPFHEMAAKNAALRRARGATIVVTNADILFSEELVHGIATGEWKTNTLYRAHRIDVRPDLDWCEIQNPANQLASGEGALIPPYYLGAGGDFCLALRQVWHSLGGFNERIRFSTRAKDWQFFLSATAQDVEIEFIGNVYHLDHDGGFRNTSSEQRNSDTVHFGKWWDIEFGLPVANRSDWGFADLRERDYQTDPRVIELEVNDYVVQDQEDSRDREIMVWLTRPSESNDTAAAVMLHSICAAHRAAQRLICRIRDARLAVTLCGFESVAARFDVEIHCNWDWPSMPGYTLRRFSPEPPVLRDGDWILEETNCGGVRLIQRGSELEMDILPQTIPVKNPEFNPLLARRLLYAYLQMQKMGKRKMAIYGAGSHTRDLLQWGVPDEITVGAVYERAPSPELCAVTDRAYTSDVVVLLSSAAFESDMLQACRDRGIHNVIALYGDWPKDMWKIGAAV